MKSFKKFTILILFTALTFQLSAQAPIDGFYPGAKSGAIALSTSFETYEDFYLGDGSTATWAGDYNITSYSLYATYGITEDFSAALSLPYISINTVNFQDEDVSRKDFQDISIYLKYRVFKKQFDGWKLEVSPAVGFFTPMTDYTVDFYGVGQQASGLDLRGVVMATLDNGIFVTAQGGGLLRFDPAPSGSTFDIKAGYFNAKWYADLYFTVQNISGGEGLPDPEDFKALAVNYSKIGATIAYNLNSDWGVYAGGGYVVDGSSVGQSMRVSGGVVWRF